jgi:hypothetical protein
MGGVGIVAAEQDDVQEADDDGHRPNGQGFLRAMSAQNERARAFDRRMRWFWMRWQLTDPEQARHEAAIRPEVPGPPMVLPVLPPEVPVAEVIVLPDVVTSSEARQVPVQRG